MVVYMASFQTLPLAFVPTTAYQWTSSVPTSLPLSDVWGTQDCFLFYRAIIILVLTRFPKEANL